MTNLPQVLIKYRIRKDSFVSTKPNQRFFFQKAKEFYLQRQKREQDDYNNFNPEKIKPHKVPNFKELNFQTKLSAEFQDNQMKKVRENICEYVKSNKLNKTLITYYLLSFFPYSFTHFFRKYFF